MPRIADPPQSPPKKGNRGEDDSKRGPNAFVPKAPKMLRPIVNPRGNRKGR